VEWEQHRLGVLPPPWPGACLGKGATYLGVGAGVGEQPERALLVAERAHDGGVGFTDLFAREKGTEGSKGE